jgi:hypothetical protein
MDFFAYCPACLVSIQGLARLTCVLRVSASVPASCNPALHHRVLLRFFLRPLCRLGMHAALLRFQPKLQNELACAQLGLVESARGVELLEPMARISLVVSGLKRCAVFVRSMQPPSSGHSSALFEPRVVLLCLTHVPSHQNPEDAEREKHAVQAKEQGFSAWFRSAAAAAR